MMMDENAEKMEGMIGEYLGLMEERKKTIRNVSEDIFKMSEALSRIEDLSVEGKIIREDLLGLLEFESNSLHQIDSLMIERRKEENSSGRRIYRDVDLNSRIVIQ